MRRRPPHDCQAAPRLWHALADMRRAVRERAAHAAAIATLGELPRGDGHAVFVIPGFLADARATAPLRDFLDQLGYGAHDWGMGRNLGPRTAGPTGERLADRFARFAAAQPRQVSLIGWSLGGIMARQLARRHPRYVRRVITLGAPFGNDPRGSSVAFLYQLVTGERFMSPRFQQMLAASRHTPPVPSTSIYSRGDGVVAWQGCRESRAPHTENIEVDGSHGGLVVHPAALRAIAERLARPQPALARPEPPRWERLAEAFARWQGGGAGGMPSYV